MARLWQSMKQEANHDDIPYPESNPLSKSGKKVLRSMKKQYGEKKGESVFYASINKKKKGSSKWHK